MSFTHTLGITYRTPEGLIASTTAAYIGPEEAGLDSTVADGSTDQEFDIAIPLAQIISMVLWSDKNVHIKTNDSGSPQEEIDLIAGRQVVWNTDMPVAAPFSNDVSKFFVTNSSGAVAKIKFRVLLESSAP